MTFAHDDEPLLDRLRDWLWDARAQADRVAVDVRDAPESESPDEDFGLYRLAEEFTSLRHELKLQTKSARGLEDQTETLMQGLRQALEALRGIQPQEAQAAWNAGKGLATALADLDEALDRMRGQLARASQRLAEEPARVLADDLDALYASQSWLGRRLARRYHLEAQGLVARQARQRHALLEALQEGCGLVQDRVTRALASEGVARIPAVGLPVDPEQMIVVELVEGTDAPAGSVVDELRRGYTWNGRLLRCAEVRAARQAPFENPL
ncbi:MAG: nucleotide exchange factor GrpE [Planctomycetales bacterium]